MADLVLKDVSVTFDAGRNRETTQALSGVNLTLIEGELVVALGASGCGKSTLLNVMAGFLQPDKGEALLYHQDQFSHPPVIEALRGPDARRGVVFQKHALLPWLNVIENVAFGLKLKGIPKTQRYASAQTILDAVGLSTFANSKVYELSGGMQQRVGIARALANDPEILLLDEPLGALDAFTRESLQELLLKLWHQTHKSMFMITHSVEEALFMASRLIVMSPRPGRITHEFDLNFNHRFLQGESARAVKSSPSFIEMRETILSLIHTSHQEH